MDIIGFYKQFELVRDGDVYFVVNRNERKILFKGNEEDATKIFIMLSAKFIEES